jgi:phosphoribosylaminoimidazolecarboxamide formyltransferase/IMP cyclohydrolase
MKIQSALISVYHKDGIDKIATKLHELNVQLYSTGGTFDYLVKLGLPVVSVDKLTGYPEIFGGRVKTLHPAVMGGILYRRNHEEDVITADKLLIPSIDCVVVDLYPFEATVKSGASEAEIIEKIDIGGISLIRAAAKTHHDVVIIPSSSEYDILEKIIERDGISQLSERKSLAARAFEVSSRYDAHIFQYLSGKTIEPQSNPEMILRYGENPHQRARFLGDFNAMFTQHHGKEISYNNLLDIDSAVQLMRDLPSEKPAAAILKHNNACGVAIRDRLTEAYSAALKCDPTSAFGGVIIFNRPVDQETAEILNTLFCEVVIAPHYDDPSLKLLSTKPNRILLSWNVNASQPEELVRSALNGILTQHRDVAVTTESDLKLATKRTADTSQIRDLLFANVLSKHTKSNTIVIAKNETLLGSGTGQTSRVDALKQAIAKAKSFGFDLTSAVMASDAFFPFPDCVEIAKNAGIDAIIQPGGSIKDQLSIDFCNANEMSMYMTGTRHFRH